MARLGRLTHVRASACERVQGRARAAAAPCADSSVPSASPCTTRRVSFRSLILIHRYRKLRHAFIQAVWRRWRWHTRQSTYDHVVGVHHRAVEQQIVVQRLGFEQERSAQ